MAKTEGTGLGLEDLEDIKAHTNPDAEDEERSNRGIAVKKENGRYKKRDGIASLGLSYQMLPPITRRKTAIYQAIGLHAIDPLSKEPVLDQSIVIPGSIIVYDPFQDDYAKKNVRLRNVVGVHTEIVNGKEEIRQKVDDIFFINGFLDVNIEKEYPLYTILELHPLNGSNRFRDKSKPAAFIRIDLNYKSTAFQNAQMDLQRDAEGAVIAMNKEDLVAYAATAGITTMARPIDEIRFDLRRFARDNSKVFFGIVKDSSAAIRMNVLDADSMGLIDYVAEKSGYIFNTDPKKPFFVHAKGEEPMGALIAYLGKKDSKQAQEAYEIMCAQLKFWED